MAGYRVISGITHVKRRLSILNVMGKRKVAQDNKTGKFHPNCSVNLQDIWWVVEKCIVYYTTKRLYSATGYIAPQGKLLGREKGVFLERGRKLSEARQRQAAKRKIA